MKTIIRHGRVWTGVTGEPVSKKSILINQGIIEGLYEAGHEPQLPPNVEEISAEGKTIIPGLINLHTHITLDGQSPDPTGTASRDGPFITLIKAVNSAREYFQSGITTIRDLGAAGGIDFALKKAITEGLVMGPRMLVSGNPLRMMGGHGSFAIEVNGADSARNAARLQLENGADVVKLMATGGVMTPGSDIGSPELTIDEMKAAVEEANKAGKISSAHAHGVEGIKNAILAGVTTVEHGTFLDEEAAQMMMQHGTCLVSTLSCGHLIFGEEGINAGISEHIRERGKHVAQKQLESIRLAHEMGVKIGLGNDSGMPLSPHGSILEEIRLLIQAGLSMDEALGTATRVAAEIIRLQDKIGTIEAGKLADIIAIDGDPLSDYQSLANVAWVMKEGQTANKK